MGRDSKLKKAVKRLAFFSCISSITTTRSTQESPTTNGNIFNEGGHCKEEALGITEVERGRSINKPKNHCAICLEVLLPGAQAIFTAQCSHSFHFSCITSNVRHGSTCCPICRANWTYLPRHKLALQPLHHTDPVLRIIDDSIATFRIHRRSSYRSERYNDDDPIEPPLSPLSSRLNLTLMPSTSVFACTYNNELSPAKQHENLTKAYLSIRLSPAPPTDLVIVASSNGTQLRLLKQAMALAVCAMRTIDRVAIVLLSTSSATRVSPLKCMSPAGKRATLQVIDRLLCVGSNRDYGEGLKKAKKMLEDRRYHNISAQILLLSDGPAGPCSHYQMPNDVSFFQFSFCLAFRQSGICIKREFEEFLGGLVGEVVRETRLKIGEKGVMVWLGDIRGGEERRVLVEVAESGILPIEYSYVEGVEGRECWQRGEDMVEMQESSGWDVGRRLVEEGGGRWSCAERWEYQDPCMARRWAKRLHGLL